MSNNAISNMLITVLEIMVFVLIFLIIIFIMLKLREKAKNKVIEENLMLGGQEEKKDKKKTKTVDNSYSKQSIFDFMEFEKVEDNMIIQKKGRRFLMVVECQGINYDLMSRMEKVAVEEGFQQFLNTLRHPIQIYIQTRTINLENSISTYRSKVKEIENKYRKMQDQYNVNVHSGNYSRKDLEKMSFELTKQRNLLEYGTDLVASTEKMSLNKNVLNKKYFIIIPYYLEETGKYDFEEIKSIAFSELYTHAQSIIRTLASCSVTGKILTSTELIELLYVAYNRDESEVFGIDKAMEARYDELYSTSEDVFEKKIKALDEKIKKDAIQLANKAVEEAKAKTNAQEKAEEQERNFENLVQRMAEVVLNENKQYIGEELTNKAIEEVKNKHKKEGDNANEKVKEKATRGRKKKDAI